MQLQGKTALITGAASGLGKAVAIHLHGLGVNIAALDNNAEALIGLQQQYPDILTCIADVSDEQAVEAALAQLKTHFAALHICINCAGIATPAPVLSRKGPQPLSQFRHAIEVNLIGSFNVLRLAAAEMVKQAPDATGERGVIINTASVAAFDGQAGNAAYSASKSGLVGMTLPLARDLASSAIRVMTIAPGPFETPMMESLPPAVRAPLTEMIQHPKRYGQPDEFAHLCQHIIENSYLNGETIRLDAGLRLHAHTLPSH